MDSGSPEVQRALSERFGLEAFRGPQAQAVDAVLAGRDLLLTMPTGGGKSLVYQLPAVVLDGLTLVVSPLIALMKDQVDALRAKGLAASFVNSSLSAAEREERLEAAVRGELDLLYVTPERFRSPRFQALEKRLPITRLSVDEAHCISQWGHDFRPDYFRLGEYRARLGNPPTAALTATATPQVADDVVTALGLTDPVVIRTGIERPNLFLGTSRVVHADDKAPVIAERIARIGGAGIVYSALIKDLEGLDAELRRRGVQSLVYHGKLVGQERRSMQERFMESEDAVVLATNAFGMGVDKADIRFVLHAQVPRTLEAWTQEVGRAGRDGKPSWCELFYFEEDLAIQQGFVRWANPSREYLLSVYETLRAWGERIATRDLDDLRDELLIKNRGDNRVGICLKWLEVLGITAGSFEGHDLRVVRDLEPGDLPDFVGSEEKLAGDLSGLYQMARFASADEGCRRALLAEHFALPAPDGPCGTCDLCARADEHLAQHFEPRAAAPKLERREELERGDWVRYEGKKLGQVVRFDERGSKKRVVVEDATTLKRRSIDVKRVERLDG